MIPITFGRASCGALSAILCGMRTSASAFTRKRSNTCGFGPSARSTLGKRWPMHELGTKNSKTNVPSASLDGFVQLCWKRPVEQGDETGRRDRYFFPARVASRFFEDIHKCECLAGHLQPSIFLRVLLAAAFLG